MSAADEQWLTLVGVWAVLWGAVGAAVGSSRGQGLAGGILGVFLGPIGLALAFTLKPTPEAQHRKLIEQALVLAAAQTLAAGGTVQAPVPAGWQPDPLGRFAQRWWNGTGWTADVTDAAGAMHQDPL